VEEQQRLIALLKEKRQAVISHAVTKGLDPDVPMKDSGVEWLGEVPVHWEVVRVKHAAKLESGHTPNKEKAEYWDGSIPWVSLNDSKKLAQYDYIDETNFTISDLGIANSSARLLPSRSVVFTRDATIGLAAITTKEMAVSQHLIAWLCHDEVVIPEYLLLVFYAMKEELDRYTFGATIKTIGMPDIRSLSMPLPSISEQKEVIGYVFAERDRLDDLVAEAQKASRLLVERRSALISAAVTGKIDVRGWQPPEKLQATNDTQKGHEAAAV
jgi:type I restriction enzyme S subunit